MNGTGFANRPRSKVVHDYYAAFKAIVAATKAKSDDTAPAVKAAETSVANVASISDQIIAAASSSASSVRFGAIITLIIGALVTIFAAVVTARLIRNPITVLTKAMLQLSTGNTDVPLKYIKRSDEIGDMSRAVEVFCGAAIENARMRGTAERLTSTANLS